MADEQQSIRSVVWQDVFPFTLIFRSFRVAIQPSKIILALVALLCIYTSGRVLDLLWPINHRAVPGEITLYLTTSSQGPGGAEAFDAARKQRLDELQRRNTETLKAIGKEGGSISDIKSRILSDRDADVAAINVAFVEVDRSATPQTLNSLAEIQGRYFVPGTAGTSLAARRDAALRSVYQRASERWAEAKEITNVGLFDTLFNYEIAQVNNVVIAVLSGNWLSAGGVPTAVVNFFMTGPSWALRHHPVFFVLFALIFLTIWALFGGAISRIAAVQVARDEKISIRQALRYAGDKFVSFFSAPLIPLVLIGVFGGLIYAGGLLGNIPVVGPIVVAALFVIGLLLAAVITLVLLGLGGGFPMMYPTIAAEGSDAFDAISRSFSYLYAKPWRMAFYSLVGIIYGALCYLFVRFFLFILLATAHHFAGSGIYLHAGDGTDLWPNLWPSPTSSTSLVYDIDFISLNWWQDIAAFLLSFWVYTTIALLGAFAISFYFSASTTIYFLMRQEVDAIELDDVYLEQSDDDLDVNDAVEPAPVAASVPMRRVVPPPVVDGGPTTSA